MYEGDSPHPNILRWNVKQLTISRTKRYLDAGVANQFWAQVDRLIYTDKAKMFLPTDAVGASTSAR
jgi:hypothetical protein